MKNSSLKSINRFVSIGDLVADVYYDKNMKLIGVDGGITSHNIICNLQNMGFNTKAFGVCGNDYLGKISIQSLNDCNVENDILIRNDINTKAYHISRKIINGKYQYKSKKYCPYCKNSSWYDGSYIDEKYILNKIKKDDILIFDNMNDKNQFIIDNCSNIKLIDLGKYDEFEHLSNEDIKKKIKDKFEIINLNERVEKYLIKRFECKNTLELSKFISTKLLMISRGKNGNDFIFNNKKYSCSVKRIIYEVDDSGAGDAFFSVIIKNWILNNKCIKEEYFNNWFDDTFNLVKKVLRLVGSRRYIKPLYKTSKKDICK